MAFVKITDEQKRREDYVAAAKTAIYRLETCAEEIGIAIEALKACVAEGGSRQALIHGNACIDCVAQISRSIEGQTDACLARTAP